MKTRFFSFLRSSLLLLKGARLQTLSAITMPIFMSNALAFKHVGVMQSSIFIYTVISGLCLQIATNLFNDVLDFQQGTDTKFRYGPTRLAQSKQVKTSTLYLQAWCFLFLFFIFGIPLVIRGGFPIIILGLVSGSLAYLYTGSSFSLLKKSGSELFCFLFFGLAACIGSYYLQTLQWNWSVVYLGIQCGLWSVSLLLINHLRDEKQDLAAARKHFVTLYGRTHSLSILCAIQACVYLLCFYWMDQGFNSGLFSFILAPLSSVLLAYICCTRPSKKYNLYLSIGSLLYVSFSSLWLFGLF